VNEVCELKRMRCWSNTNAVSCGLCNVHWDIFYTSKYATLISVNTTVALRYYEIVGVSL